MERNFIHKNGMHSRKNSKQTKNYIENNNSEYSNYIIPHHNVGVYPLSLFSLLSHWSCPERRPNTNSSSNGISRLTFCSAYMSEVSSDANKAAVDW